VTTIPSTTAVPWDGPAIIVAVNVSSSTSEASRVISLAVSSAVVTSMVLARGASLTGVIVIVAEDSLEYNAPSNTL